MALTSTGWNYSKGRMTLTKLTLSTLPKTWIIDVDGVIFQHNEYLSGVFPEKPLQGVKTFFKKIPQRNKIVKS